MAFSETLTSLRKTAGLSQEKLAERLGVSRQAVTKWETGAGEPTLENIRALATLFRVSFDTLLGDGIPPGDGKEQIYESVTEYDVDSKKRFDIHLGDVRKATLSADGGEKLRVRLSSRSIESIQSDFKIKLDDIKGRIDVDVIRQNKMTRAVPKAALIVEITLPQKYLSAVEVAAHASELALASLGCPSVELDGRIASLSLSAVRGRVEVQSNFDMMISLDDFSGSLELNQLFATSRIRVPDDFQFRQRTRGIANRTHYEEGGMTCGPFAMPGAENCIELNGMKNELVIAR